MRGDKALTVLHIIDTLEGGGAERLLASISPRLQNDGVKVAVACLHNRDRLAREFTANDIPVCIASDSTFTIFKPWSRNQQQAFHRLKEFVARINPDLIHAHLGASYVVTHTLAKQFNKPYILTIHGEARWWPEFDIHSRLSLGYWSQRINQILIRKAFKNAHKILCVSSGVKSKVELLIPGLPNVDVFENCVNAQFSQTPKNRNLKDIDLVMCGRLVTDKNPLFAIRVLRKVIDRGHNVSAMWIGDGPLRKACEEEIMRIELNQSFHLAGWLDVDEIIKRYDSARLFFLPSLTEGLALVAIEALSRDLPAVLSDIPANKSTFTGEPGVRFYSSGDEDQAATAIIEMLSNDHELPDPQRIVDRFGIDRYVENLKEIYEKATA